MHQAETHLHRAGDHWPSAPSPFRALVDTIGRRLDRLGDGDRRSCSEAVRQELAQYLQDPALLDGMQCVLHSRSYSRLLLHADPAGRFSVLALLWTPGCETPVHAHHAWCAFGLHNGFLVEETYREDGAEESRPTLFASHDLIPGDALCDDSDGSYAHRLANRSRSLAMSLHVYGVSADRVDNGVNRILLV